MTQWSPLSKPLDRPVRSLILLFAAWKILLLFIAILSPGPGYDTSTSLAQPVHASNVFENAIAHLCNKLTRWDALYYTKVAKRGYLYEQEWAFGWGFTRTIALFVKGRNCYFPSDYTFAECLGLQSLGLQYHPDYLESLAGIVISHAAHLLSVIVLHNLTLKVFIGDTRAKIALLSASLHIISPSGLFLSAPCAESPFALLSLTGYYLFAVGTTSDGIESAIGFWSAGIVFAISTTFRSNGLLNGLLFAEAALRTLFSFKDGLSFEKIQRLASIGTGGFCIGVGFLLPQIIAYEQLCADGSRIWCQRSIPSVYIFVQDYYW